jgi:hypothetical protein
MVKWIETVAKDSEKFAKGVKVEAKAKDYTKTRAAGYSKRPASAKVFCKDLQSMSKEWAEDLKKSPKGF